MLNFLSNYFNFTLSYLKLSSKPLISIHSNPTKILNPLTNKSINLKEILDSCQSINGGNQSWYRPTTYLANGHLATIYCTLDHSAATSNYSRTYLKVPDGGTIALDFSPPLSKEDPIDSKPILVIQHGLTGGSHESYVIDIVNKITKSKEEGGLNWRALVVNFRGCANSPITSKQLYHGGYTNDLRCALAYLSQVAPTTPLYGIGFSLGANVLARYVGEEGEQTPLKSVIILGAPWDFLDGHVCLSSSWLRRIYSKAMASNLRRLVQTHKKHFESDKRLDLPALFSNPHQTLYEFDSQITRILGGFPTTEAYYRYASASQLTLNISIPLLSISAMDDPIVTTTTIPYLDAYKNSNLIFIRTASGGHLGWWENLFKPKRWISKPVLEWFNALEKADPSFRKHFGEILEDENEKGMYLVKGGNTIGDEIVGFKVVEFTEEEINDEIDEVVNGGMIKGL